MASLSLSPVGPQSNRAASAIAVGEGTSGQAPGVPVRGCAGAPAPEASPPNTDRGVEFCLHWLALTIWADAGFVGRWVGELIGVPMDAGWEVLPHGARGFHQLAIGPMGAKLYSSPASDSVYCSVELPGELSSSLPPEWIQKKIGELELTGTRYRLTRLDLAWDHSYYAPADVLGAVEAGQVRSLAKRETLREFREPFKGGHTVYFGSRSSERMLRVYLKDGRTRTELELKGQRAELVFLDLMGLEPSQWVGRCLAHLRDYCDFMLAWWDEFCAGFERAGVKLSRGVAQSFERLSAWLARQVAPALALYESVLGVRALVELADGGYARLRQRHRVMAMAVGVEV